MLKIILNLPKFFVPNILLNPYSSTINSSKLHKKLIILFILIVLFCFFIVLKADQYKSKIRIIPILLLYHIEKSQISVKLILQVINAVNQIISSPKKQTNILSVRNTSLHNQGILSKFSDAPCSRLPVGTHMGGDPQPFHKILHSVLVHKMFQ